MNSYLPRLVVPIAIALLAGSSCGEESIDNRATPIAQDGPMSIVTAPVTTAVTEPATPQTPTTAANAAPETTVTTDSTVTTRPVGDRTPPIASTLNRPADTTATTAATGNALPIASTVTADSTVATRPVGDRTPPIASTLNRPADTTTSTTTVAPAPQEIAPPNVTAMEIPVTSDSGPKPPAPEPPSPPEEVAAPERSQPDPSVIGSIIWWRPGLQEEAFRAIDPSSTGADLWYEEKQDRGTTPHRFYRFYYMGEEDTQTEMWRRWQRTLDVFWSSPMIYYPVRYDLSWHDHPDTVKVVATWPLGEQRELLVTEDGFLADIELPFSPPLPLTIPYAEPRFPETAHLLGRDCPPVEQLWSPEAPVEDSCTLSAVRTAFQFAHAAATPEQTQAAVRDGHVLAETIRQVREDHQDSFSAYWFDPANPGHYLAEVRNVRWAGLFPGASMISAEFRLYARPGLADSDMQERARAKIQEQVDAGLDVPEWALSGELPTGPPPPHEGFWDTMMVVRTADGTWRMSYPMWCFSMELKVHYALSCPDDPNPVWSDSIWDFDLFPPNHLDFWLNATPEQRRYLGIPPS